MDEVVREIFKDYPDNVVHYEALLEAKGNMGDVFGSGNGDLGEIVTIQTLEILVLLLIQPLQRLFLMKQKNI